MIDFILPGMYEHYNLNFSFLRLMHDHPEFFRPDVRVSAVYGNFQFNIFDGGRIFYNYRHTTKEEIEYVVDVYNNEFNVPVRQVFTNTQLKPEDYANRFGNLCLALCENPLNELVINDDNFAKYVHQNYPNYSFVSSTTKCLNNPKLLMEELQKPQYKMVCLDYNLNKNKKMLESLPEELRDKCEFLVNAICPPGCPSRKEHYRLNSLFSLTYGKAYHVDNCPIRTNTIHPNTINANNTIRPEEIYDYYVPNGYHLFKIEGRTLSTVENAINYVRYMVNPEYQWYVLLTLLPDNSNMKLLEQTFDLK